jgi:hypothetical protein
MQNSLPLEGFFIYAMNELIIISNSINSLQNLVHKDFIFLDDLQEEFRPDLQNYIVGATLSMNGGKLVIGNNLYKAWLNKIKTRGFDYEIDFKL